MTKPKFFRAPGLFRAWLDANHQTEVELLVGFYKVESGKPSITWPQSVDEALCYGWIDGVRRRIDEESYTIRFTPRKPKSIWSAVNIKRMGELIAAGRVARADLRPSSVATGSDRNSTRTSDSMRRSRRRCSRAFSGKRRRGRGSVSRRHRTSVLRRTGCRARSGKRRARSDWRR